MPAIVILSPRIALPALRISLFKAAGISDRGRIQKSREGREDDWDYLVAERNNGESRPWNFAVTVTLSQLGNFQW